MSRVERVAIRFLLAREAAPKVQKALDTRFGKDSLIVDVGEKGHLSIRSIRPNMKLGQQIQK